MRNHIVAASFFIIGSGAMAEEAPDLTGTWVKTAGHIMYWNGEVNQFPHQYDQAIIVIHDQVGPVFKATQMTVPGADGHTGRHGNEPISGDGHPILGTVDWDGRSVILADVDDTTTQRCNLVATDRMECTAWEAGPHALAGRYVIERERP
ncbi:MAG: hypothetical protein ROR55_21315 [Devosia sp.]